MLQFLGKAIPWVMGRANPLLFLGMEGIGALAGGVDWLNRKYHFLPDTWGDIFDVVDDFSILNSLAETAGWSPHGGYNTEWGNTLRGLESLAMLVAPGSTGVNLARMFLSGARNEQDMAQAGMQPNEVAVGDFLPGPGLAGAFGAGMFGDVGGGQGAPQGTIHDLLAAAAAEQAYADAARVRNYADWLATQPQMAELYTQWHRDYPEMSRQSLRDAANLVL